MTTKPVAAARRHLNFQQLANELESKLERTLSIRNDKIYQRFAANFDGNHKTQPQQQPQKIKRAAVATVAPVSKPPRKSLYQQSHQISNVAADISHNVYDGEDDSKIDIHDDAESHDRHSHHSNWRQLVAERDQHIEQLISLVDELHAHNARFAAENEQLLVQQQEYRQHDAKKSALPCADCTDHLQRQQCLQLELNERTVQMDTHSQDVRMLKTLVYRLNVQLERHQDDLRRLGAPADAFEQPTQHTAAASTANATTDNQQQKRAWGNIQMHTLAPLLNAYTAQMAEQRDLIAQHELDAVHFTGRLKTVLTENETLHGNLDDLRHSTAAWQNEQTRLRAQLDVCRQRAEVQTRRADLAKQKLVEVLRCYEQKVQAQHLDVERLQEAYARANGELLGLRGLQQQPQAVAESVRECQRLFEVLRDRHEEDRTKLGSECDALRKRCVEADEMVRRTTEELAAVRQTLRDRDNEAGELTRKNAALRQSLGRVRLSREAFRTRLKESGGQTPGEAGRSQAMTMAMEQQAQQQQQFDVDALWRNRAEVHARYVEEIERLTRKLQQRDNTLRRLLQAKCRYGSGGNGEAAAAGNVVGDDAPEERKEIS